VLTGVGGRWWPWRLACCCATCWRFHCRGCDRPHRPYAIGDVVLNHRAHDGFVWKHESFNTQLRGLEASTSLPNGQIAASRTSSKDLVAVNFTIEVQADEDLPPCWSESAGRRKTCATDPDWSFVRARDPGKCWGLESAASRAA